MRTVFVGAGQGGLAVLEMYDKGQLDVLGLELMAVVDTDPQAPGYRFAQDRGWRVLDDLEEALALPRLELIIELTGKDQVLSRVQAAAPPGARVMDHVMARVFWDLERELRNKTQLERHLRAERAELQEIYDTLPGLVMVLDRDMRVLRANRRFEQITGKTREQIAGMLCTDALAIPDDDEDYCLDCAEPFSTAVETGTTISLVQNREGGTGREGHFQVTAQPIFDDSGNIVRVVQMSSDISEVVKLQRETEESARRFTQIMDAVHGIITIRDLDGRYEFVNPRAEVLFGMSRDQMVGKTPAELFPREVAELLEANDRVALERGGHHTTEEVLGLNRRRHWLITERFPLRDYRGKIAGICVVSRDDTRARRLQQDLVQTERLAAVGKLAAGVAHELNNPLTGILTFAEDLMLEAAEDDPARQDLEMIVNETLRCRRIVRDLLDFSRMKKPERQRVSVGHVIRRAVGMVERQASFHNIRFELDEQPDLPEVLVDPGQLQQAILNLLVNARDAMDSVGRIHIQASRRRNRVVIAVSDEGCGIPEHARGEIFEPFFSTKGERGNGLGLPAVLSVLTQHGGTVELDSEVERGTTFRLVLPGLEASGA